MGSGKELGSPASPIAQHRPASSSPHTCSTPWPEGSPKAQWGFPRGAGAAGRRVAHIISSVFHSGSVQLGVWLNRSYCLPGVSKAPAAGAACCHRSVRNGLLRSCRAIRTPGCKWRGVPTVAAQAAPSLVHDPAQPMRLCWTGAGQGGQQACCSFSMARAG